MLRSGQNTQNTCDITGRSVSARFHCYAVNFWKIGTFQSWINPCFKPLQEIKSVIIELLKTLICHTELSLSQEITKLGKMTFLDPPRRKKNSAIVCQTGWKNWPKRKTCLVVFRLCALAVLEIFHAQQNSKIALLWSRCHTQNSCFCQMSLPKKDQNYWRSPSSANFLKTNLALKLRSFGRSRLGFLNQKSGL